MLPRTRAMAAVGAMAYPGRAARPAVAATAACTAPATHALLRVYVTSRIEGLAARVESAFATSALGDTHTLELVKFCPESPEHAADAEIVLGDPGIFVPVIDAHLPRLRWLQSTWAGVNALMDGTKRRDYTLTRLAGVFGQLMAEYIIGQILVQERGFCQADVQQRARRWDESSFLMPRKLTSLTVSLLGMGDIGQVVARRAKAMGLRVVALVRPGASPPLDVDESSAQMEEVLARADYVVNILPSTPATRGLLGGGRLRHCHGAIFINVGRGDVVDEASLVEALEQGWLSHAILDVFAKEPLPDNSSLWDHPRVRITPHVSAPSLPEDVASVFVQNLARYVAKTELLHLASWEKGY